MSLGRAGRYELLAPLGAGGMAELFVARPVGETRAHVFALKRILPRHARDPRFVEMFMRELSVASAVCHRNLVHVVDHGVADDHCFMVMEYVHGADLATLLNASADGGAQVPIDVAIALVVEIAHGLHHLHEQPDRQGGTPQLVHRDVSPSNVLVSYDGAVKLTDFGIATATAYTRTTDAGTLKGKVGYMSPEQCRGDALDRRSDIYALGILLYEVTVGERLFFADNDYAVMNKILGGRLDSPSKLRSGYPPGLEAIAMRALSTDRRHRYATAADFSDALLRFATASGMSLSTASVAHWVRRVASPTPYPVFPATPTLVAARPVPVAEPRRARGWVAAAAAAVAMAVVAVVAVAVGRTPQPSVVHQAPQVQTEREPTPAAPARESLPPPSPAVPESHAVDEVVIFDEVEATPEPAPRTRQKKRAGGSVRYDLDAARPPR